MTRGLSLFNPGNIRLGIPAFKGEFKPSKDTEFRQFQTMQMGIRAIAIILMHYYDDYDIKTIRGIISRWAPPADNNPTSAYIDEVSQRSGYDPDESLDLTQAYVLEAIIPGIIDEENGTMGDITTADISAAVALALQTV